MPLDRIRLHPFPGTATVEDVIRLCDREPKCLCELVDGVFVEKVMGTPESRLAAWLIFTLQTYLNEYDLGILTGADGPLQILADQVRFPDVAFLSYDRIPADADPSTPVPDWIPTLAVEVLSPSNTKQEMARKLWNYFEAGVELVWYVDPSDRTVRVYHSPEAVVTLTESDDLDGEQLLPGVSPMALISESVPPPENLARDLRPGNDVLKRESLWHGCTAKRDEQSSAVGAG